MLQCILFFVHIFTMALSQMNPTISFISKEAVVNIGDDVELQCTVLYADEYSVIWAKLDLHNPSGIHFISTGTNLVVPDDRYKIFHNKETGNYTLQINKLQEIDAGLYQCQVITGPASKLNADVWVHVRLPPVISDNSTRSVITTIAATVTLNCYAAGYPKPRISWRRESNELLPTGGAMFIGSSLTIYNITKDDRGTYYCIADNGVGKGARRNIGIEVEFPPVVTVEKPRYGQALQYDMDLQCHVEAFPSPSIVWQKDGVTLNDNQHYLISIFATANEFTDATLRIITIEKRQYGNYTCKATNKLGSQEKIVELFETVNVVCPPACGHMLLTSSQMSNMPSILHIVCIVVLAIAEKWLIQLYS